MLEMMNHLLCYLLCLFFYFSTIFGAKLPSSKPILPKISSFPRSSNKASITSSTKSTSTTTTRPALFRVVTDIDDTVKSSGAKNIFGIYLGGVDSQYKRGTFYPGAFQFSWELSSFNRKSKSASVPRVAVLTARAREFKFALALKPKSKIVQAFQKAGNKMGSKNEWGIGDVLYGSVVEWILQERKGIRKFDNFEILMKRDDLSNGNNRQKYVLVGDTGEKDEDAGIRIITKYPKRIKGIFLHTVKDTPNQSSIKLPNDRIYKGVPIMYFRTYVGAASKAVEAGLMDSKGLDRVIKQSRMDLLEIESKSIATFGRKDPTWASDLNKDIRGSKRIHQNLGMLLSGAEVFGFLRQFSTNKRF